MASQKVVDISLTEIVDFCQKHSFLLTSVAVTGLSLFGLRKYFAGGVCRSKVKLLGKTAIVTGANIGIGKETARDLAARGARVILACRDITKAERAAADIRQTTGSQQVLVRVVDLASLESVRRFCHQIENTEDRLDILVNNAGIMACPQWKSEEGYEMQMAVNHLGHFLMTNLLLQLLKNSSPSRVINVSGDAYRMKGGIIDLDDINMEKDYKPWSAYVRSKQANILFTRELHKRSKGSGLSVFVVHPGVVHTNLPQHCFPDWQNKLFMASIGWLLLKTVEQGAQTSIHCAVAEGLEEFSGQYFSDCQQKDLLPMMKDDDLAHRLWELSSEMVALPGYAKK